MIRKRIVDTADKPKLSYSHLRKEQLKAALYKYRRTLAFTNHVNRVLWNINNKITFNHFSLTR